MTPTTNKRFVATVKWNGGNSRSTVEVFAVNRADARVKAIAKVRFNYGHDMPASPTVTFS